MKHILFVCVRNSGRSQMAEAFLNALGPEVATAESAGTEPAEQLNPTVVQVMNEAGFDMSGQYPKVMDADMVARADRVITMGCDVDAGVCPAGYVASEDWALEDPKGKPVEVVRGIRDEVRRKVEDMIRDLKTWP
ncbi:MAG: arsenate reductase ArsC [Armatimonadota bacterium]|nr:arsenate reductase ArsC [Armatimonadota bacterium]